jgi:NAD(P)-dependent dehydrogenase (short-subunit alcohol dehydrogenase family)
VVTGATRGIGRALTIELARRGCAVWVVCRDRERADALVAEVRGDVRPVIADLASLRSTAAPADRILADPGPIHALVCNAAVVHDRFATTRAE